MSSFCLGCGNSITDGERFCGVCGRNSQPGASVPAIDPQVAFGLPPQTSGKAIFSLVCGILFLLFPFAVVALVFGYISLSEIRKSAGRLKGNGLAISGIVLGYLGVLFIVGVFGLGIYEVRKTEREMNKSKTMALTMGGGEASVVSSMRTLNMAEIAYGQAHRDIGYTCSLPDLSGTWGISSELAAGKKHGYNFELKNCAAVKPGGPVTRYQLIAYSAEPGGRDKPAYCTDESDVIRSVGNGSSENCFAVGTELPEQEINKP